MSERGSFITEYIYCPNCLKKLEEIFLKDKDKYLMATKIPHYADGNPLPIIAGKIGGLYSEEELDTFRYKIFNKQNAPCHPVRIAVLADNGSSRVFIVFPSGEIEEYNYLRKKEMIEKHYGML